MTDQSAPSDVTELDGYGEGITGITPEGRRRMPQIVFTTVRKEFGVLRGILFLIVSVVRGLLVRHRNPDATAVASEYSFEASIDFPLLIGMYETAAAWTDEEAAYELLESIIKTSATYQMYDLYPVSELQGFPDTFEAFKRYNYGMFEDDENYPMEAFVDESDYFQIDVGSCANVEIAQAFGYPELACLGCDHDLAGYPVIEDEVNAVFHRTRTIAKGDEKCDFQFYRKGTEPELDEPKK